MVKLRVSLSDEEYAAIQKKADSYGLSASVYARDAIVRDASPQDQANHHTENNILRAIRGLIPTLAEALGHTQNADRQMVDELSKILLERYAKETGKE